MENVSSSTPSSTTSTTSSKTKFPESLIQHYLNGYKEMRLVSSEEVLSTLIKGQIRKCPSLPDTPPLSPRKIRTPDEISLCSSSLPGCKFGACAIKRIQHGTWFGPFEGKLVRTTEVSGMVTDYMWEIFHDGEVSHYLDGFNENNWMAFVRCARHKKEQNLVVFQYHGCIYYRSTRDILPGNELLVWYDSKYTQLLGIPLTWNDSRGTTSKRKNSITSCTDDQQLHQQQHQHQQRKKREKVAPLSLLQQIDYKPQQTRKNELEFLASLIAKNAPSALSSNLYEHSSAPIKKDGVPTTGPLRCDKCFFSFHSKEQLITHKCISSSPWSHQPGLTQHRLTSLEKHQPLHRPIHVTPSYGIEPPSSLASHYHNYYQNLSYAYPSPPMEPMKNFCYKSNILPMKNF